MNFEKGLNVLIRRAPELAGIRLIRNSRELAEAAVAVLQGLKDRLKPPTPPVKTKRRKK